MEKMTNVGNKNLGNKADKTEDKSPVKVKKYANRRLYHTGRSAYVTLDDIADMIKRGEEFVVTDANSGKDLTRQVLTQIIIEQESKGKNLLPISFLRDVIRFYGDSMESLVPNYLEKSFTSFVNETNRWRDMMPDPFSDTMAKPIHEQFQRNLSTFQSMMGGGFDAQGTSEPDKTSSGSSKGVSHEAPSRARELESQARELESMRSEMKRIREELDNLRKR